MILLSTVFFSFKRWKVLFLRISEFSVLICVAGQNVVLLKALFLDSVTSLLYNVVVIS